MRVDMMWMGYQLSDGLVHVVSSESARVVRIQLSKQESILMSMVLHHAHTSV